MKNRSLIVTQFIVFSLLIIIPLICITSISNYTIMKYSEAEISKSGTGELKVAQSITDLISQTISNDILNLSMNQKLNSLYGIDNIHSVLKSSDDNLMLIQLLETLSNIVETNSLYSSIYIYLDNSNYIITSNGVYLKEDFQDKGWLNQYLRYKNLQEPISWINPRPSDTNGDRKTYVMSYIFPLTPYTTKLRGSIAINVYENSLCEHINSNTSNSNDNISIINTNGEVISHVDKALISANISDKPYVSKILGSSKNEGYFIQKVDNTKCLVTYLKTGNSGWIYVGVFSLDSLYNKVNSMKATIIYISMALLILGICLSYLISRKIYNPVKKLAQQIKSIKNIDCGNENEVTILSRTFDAMIKEEDKLFRTIEKSRKNLRENYILSLLRGIPESENEYADNAKVFPYINFICCIITIDKYKDFIENFSYENQYYLKTAILNLSEEVLAVPFACHGIVMDGNKIVLIVNSDDNISSEYSSLCEYFHTIQKEAAKVIETTITVCLGNMYDDIQKIRNSYHEAQTLLKHKFISGYEKIIIYEQEYTNHSSKYFYPFTLEKQILNNVDVGSKEALLVSVNDFIDEVKNNKDLTYDNIMLILNQLLGSTIKYLLNLNISVSKIFGSDFNIYSKLAENETLDETGLFLANIFLQIIEYREKIKFDDKSHIVKIMEYIHDNYKQDIAINTLADHVGLSYSHVRKIFNDATGENIVNYINNMRIEEAQRLLRQTSMSINDIALGLGYNNKQSFNRFFKKYVSINPGEYRNIKSNL
ncbi:AraC family transcriptional regulator [Ruminiclostridium sufflavum DSM 19573]|uniref:AraC family transcriptional regulator n=1 Tax=Ruminiclostridium sufflavum DSM 19573 TaxID=1121337 RepID=A0A318XU23_9FIRM|nr:helix-turn-helix domain-containing protein [Ruminiclostridium sufflavum]PYG85842.1 AraC family transcriptional regulator [Ruminiclostridium sufflavum DSM 19573]